MKWIFISVLLVVAVIFIAGCTGHDEPAEQTITTATQHLVTQSGSSARPLFTGTVAETAIPPATVKIFTGEYLWVAYRENSSVTIPPNPRSSWIYYHRLERLNGSYKGSPVSIERVTTISDYPECCIDNVVTITKNGSIFIADAYSDPSTGRNLGATLSKTIKGVAQPPEEYPPDDSGAGRLNGSGPVIGGWMGFSPFKEPEIILTEAGTDPVTVPAGTYPDAVKYTARFSDGTPITFWVAPDVPVPVRYDFPDKYLDGIDPFRSYELAGWG